MKKILVLHLIAITVTVVACTKKDSNESDHEAPVLTISNPADNQTFTGSQSINISGTATDNKYIDEVHLEITNLVTAEEYLHIHIHPDAATCNFTQPFTIQPAISYKIRVIADDGSANSTAKTIEISCN